ncbi:MAG TPA: proline--tRNA ligase [Candidatus Paceibacterota bacterium]
MKDKNTPITPRAEDYSQWYLDVIREADLCDYSPVKGCMILKPRGYALWEQAVSFLDAEIKKSGVQNAYFPLFIPQRLLTKEKEHVEGFAPELAIVTHGGGEALDEPLVVRPTSETIMYETFKDWVQSYRDLPLLINQWANVVRWEKKTKPFLRTTEFLWQEGHTVHATYEEAEQRTLDMLDMYRRYSEKMLALPVIVGQKTEQEKFAGALKTYTCEAMMQDGKALQFATSHNLGQNFAKAFEINFLTEKNEYEFGWQTSWGVTTRSIGGMIMAHSDDKGLVIPPNMAATKVVIIPFLKGGEDDAKVLAYAEQLASELKNNSITATIDVTDKRPGEKHYQHERFGTPIRIEVGGRELENNSFVYIARDLSEKQTAESKNLVETIKNELTNMHGRLFDIVQNRLDTNIQDVSTYEEFKQAIEDGKFVRCFFDGTAKTEELIKEETGASTRCYPLSEVEQSGICIKTGVPVTSKKVIFARAY